MQARLDYLENKLNQLEQAEAAQAAKKSKGAVKEKSSPKNNRLSSAGPANSSTAKNDQSTAQADRTSGSKKLTPAEAASAEQQTGVAQETFLFRDQSPTLKKGQAEASIGFDYMRSTTAFQSDRIVTGTANFRYGVIDGMEVSLAVPYYTSTRSTSTFPGQQYDDTEKGLGGATVGLNYSLLQESADWPGIAVSVSGIYPGDASPYNFSNFQYGQNPINPLASVQNPGHWGIGANFVAYKIVDPLVIFAGSGIQYYFPRNFSGYNVEPAPRYLGNMGVSFAVSEKTTLGFAVSGFYQPDLKVDGIKAPQSAQEQYVARAAVTQRIFENTWVEPAVAMGLTKDSPDLDLSVTVRRRW